VVSLLATGNDGPTVGFSYWDYEELIKKQREEAYLEASSDVITPTVVPTPILMPATPAP
jgi:hypothetical protein